MMLDSTPWISSRKLDICFIALPSLFVVALVACLAKLNLLPAQMNWKYWLVFVVFIDVAHVWSTLYRTYLHKKTSLDLKKKLILIPLFSWVFATFLSLYFEEYFWRVLAYIAVFHFIKQQYGFYRIYERGEIKSKGEFLFEKITFYSLMLMPIIHWHMHVKKISWFVTGDFFNLTSVKYLEKFLWWGFYLLVMIYFLNVLNKYLRHKTFNIGKELIFVITLLIWYVGIVYIDNDWGFTITNVVNHGVPYLYLVFISNLYSGFNGKHALFSNVINKSLTLKVTVFLASVAFFGYFEEMLWDLFIWRENSQAFFGLKVESISRLTQSLLIGVLIVPQLSHYILDRYIWKGRLVQ